MIENLQNYQLENKQAKGAEICANIRSWRTKNAPKTFFEVLERQNMKNQTIFELYTDDNKSKYSSNPMKTLKPAKKIMKLYTKWTSTTTTQFVWKIPNRKKKSYEHFNLCEAEISFDEIIKSITNNKPPGNDGLTAEFYRNFSKELAPVLLGVYDSWGKLTPWVLLIQKESYLPLGPYHGQTTSEKQVVAQNEMCPNRDMQNYLKNGK